MKPLQLAFVLSLVVAQFLVFVILLRGNKAESDFPAFYSAARVWQSGKNPYDLNEQCKAQDELRPQQCLPMAHPPFLLPLVASVVDDDFSASYWRWVSVLVVVSLVFFLPLYYLTRNLELSIECLFFIPLLAGIALGQDTPFVVLSILVWAYLLLAKRDLGAGLVLSFATLKPHLAILLSIPLLFSRPKAFLGFALGSLVLVGVSFSFVGLEGFRGLVEITGRMSEGKGFGISQAEMPSVTGLLVWIGINPKWSWLAFISGLLGISFLWTKTTSRPALAIGLVVALFVSPHLHTHDLALLLIPIVFAYPLALPLASSIILIGLKFHLGPLAAYFVMGYLVYVHGQSLRFSSLQRPSTDS